MKKNSITKAFLTKSAKAVDFLLAPATLMSAVLLKLIRKAGMQRMPISKAIFCKVGVFPIRDHYYEPLFKTRNLYRSLREDRFLPGIDFNIDEQLKLIEEFDYNAELERIPITNDSKTNIEFYYHNDSFVAGDAEMLYNIIRLFKPEKIIEIGSGHSTLMAIKAIATNKEENNAYFCQHICIEPYENQWLEQKQVKVIRKKLEEVEKSLFETLNRNDILFIDSSHIIRPQGDVVREYLEILPTLKSGVLVHIHDIFTPKDYLDEWVLDEIKLWNEQYILEAFLTCNSQYRVKMAMNLLKHRHFEKLAEKCPILKNEPLNEPGSFWIMRN
jgi:predicted O-methyltransferase YrrM